MSNKTENKKVVQDALIEAQQLIEAVQQMTKENTKAILRETVKQTYKDVIQESLSPNKEKIVNEQDDMNMSYDDDMGMGDSDDNLNDLPDIDSDVASDTEDQLEVDDDLDISDTDDDEYQDLTGLEPDQAVQVFKDAPDDVQIIKVNGGSVQFSDDETGKQYIVQTENRKEKMKNQKETIYEVEISEEEVSECGSTDEVVYEIEINEDELSEGYTAAAVKPEFESSKNRTKTVDTTGKTAFRETAPAFEGESSKNRTKRIPGGGEPNANGTFAKKPVASNLYQREGIQKKINKVVAENKALKQRVSQFENVLPGIKEKVNELKLYNVNLTHVTKLFTECATTKEEKLTIVEQFDGVGSVEESKKLYLSILQGLQGNNKTVKESIQEGIVRKATSTEKKANINESSTADNSEINRMKALMNYDYKK